MPIVIACAWALSWPAAGQVAVPPRAVPGSDQNAMPTGTIRGRILTANERPARRASVWILPPTGGFPRTVSADLQGRYEFTAVPAGDYRLSAGKPGYLALEYGQQRAFEQGTVLTVRNGETLEKIDITLPGSGAITGRVVDANGDPVEGISVRVMQLQFAANRRRPQGVAGAGRRLTNDQGQYRLYGLPPGEYIIMASLADQPAAQTSVILPAGYAPTYAPDTPNASAARRVTVGLSEQVDDINITLAQVATARVSGMVVDSLGKPVRARILVSPSYRSGVASVEPAATASDADGRFEIHDVPSGEWVLQASMGGNVTEGQEGQFVSRYVTVNGTNVDDVLLPMSIGSRVEGRIVFEGNAAADPTGVAVGTVQTDFDLAPLAGPNAVAKGHPDSTFVLTGLNGPRRLRVRAPTPWSLKAIRARGRDITDEPLSFGSKDDSLTDVEIVLTTAAASVTGHVTDARGQVTTDCTVIVFSTSTDLWYQGSRFLTITRPRPDGTFTVAALPSGDYYVVAVDRLQGTEQSGEWQDPAFLDSIAPRAARLTLGDGQVASILLKLTLRRIA
ncbi:MAG TPA: carboxypeptidase-like regulatory domain-containing protein [Vicinamibacterales bacterium]|nr:carboxypeptidase-like regulatory domain-containing protein [Vicinamibacterales bacterium]